jgi:hypothetical protein
VRLDVVLRFAVAHEDDEGGRDMVGVGSGVTMVGQL